MPERYGFVTFIAFGINTVVIPVLTTSILSFSLAAHAHIFGHLIFFLGLLASWYGTPRSRAHWSASQVSLWAAETPRSRYICWARCDRAHSVAKHTRIVCISHGGKRGQVVSKTTKVLVEGRCKRKHASHLIRS